MNKYFIALILLVSSAQLANAMIASKQIVWEEEAPLTEEMRRTMPLATVLEKSYDTLALHNAILRAIAEGQVNIAVSYSQTPLHLASNMGNIDDMRLLLANKANPNAKNDSGSTPLMNEMIRVKPDRERIELLLNHGAHINEQDNEENTALHLLMRNLQTCIEYKVSPEKIIHLQQIADLLIERGARTDIKNKHGETPMNKVTWYSSAQIQQHSMRRVCAPNQ